MEDHRSIAGTGQRVHEKKQELNIEDGRMRVSKIVIDEPRQRSITTPMGNIRGWFAIHGYELPKNIEFRVGPVALPHVLSKRSDVEGAMPEHSVIGFQVKFDLFNYLPFIEDDWLEVELTVPDFERCVLRFRITEKALAACIAAASGG